MHGRVEGLSRVMAGIGGGVLTLLMLMTCGSIVGRALNSLGHWGPVEGVPGLGPLLQGFGPVPGDFEIVEAGIAFAVFAFLPWCQLRAGHATVDLFTAPLPDAANRVLLAIWDTLFAATLVLIAWRLGAGTAGKVSNGETTLLLQFPVWWAYALSLFGSIVAAIVSVWVAVIRVGAVFTGRDVLPLSAGGGH